MISEILIYPPGFHNFLFNPNLGLLSRIEVKCENVSTVSIMQDFSHVYEPR